MKPYEGEPVYGADDAIIGVGFGMAMLMQDGQPVWMEGQQEEWDDYMTFGDAKKLAKKAPTSVWEIHLVGPLSEHYFRLVGTTRKKWKLFATGRGFA